MSVAVPRKIKFTPAVFKKSAESQVVGTLRPFLFGFFEVLAFVKVDHFLADHLPVLLERPEFWKVGHIHNGFLGALLGE